jgi:hypothetical protein
MCTVPTRGLRGKAADNPGEHDQHKDARSQTTDRRPDGREAALRLVVDHIDDEISVRGNLERNWLTGRDVDSLFLDGFVVFVARFGLWISRVIHTSTLGAGSDIHLHKVSQTVRGTEASVGTRLGRAHRTNR